MNNTEILFLKNKNNGKLLVVIDDIIEGVFKVPFVMCLSENHGILPLDEIIDKYTFPIMVERNSNIVTYVKEKREQVLQFIEYYQSVSCSS